MSVRRPSVVALRDARGIEAVWVVVAVSGPRAAMRRRRLAVSVVAFDQHPQESDHGLTFGWGEVVDTVGELFGERGSGGG